MACPGRMVQGGGSAKRPADFALDGAFGKSPSSAQEAGFRNKKKVIALRRTDSMLL